MSSLTRILSRVAALTLLGVLLGAGWFYVVAPITARIDDMNETIEHNRQLIVRLARNIGGGDEHDAAISALKERIKASDHFLRADTESLAAAAIRQRLLHVLDAAKAEMKSFQALASDEHNGLTRVSVRVVLQGEYDALMQVFYRLETEAPYLFMDDLRIKAVALRRRAREEGGPKALSVVFQLSGYMLPREDS